MMKTRPSALAVFVVILAVGVLSIPFLPRPEAASANPCPNVELVDFDQLPEGTVRGFSGSCFPAGVVCVAPSYSGAITLNKYWCAFPSEGVTPPPATTVPILLPHVPFPVFTG